MPSQERLDYYLTVARLMAEAEAQMRADALDGGSVGYAADLAELLRCVRGAEEAAARIAADLADSRIERVAKEKDTSTVRH